MNYDHTIEILADRLYDWKPAGWVGSVVGKWTYKDPGQSRVFSWNPQDNLEELIGIVDALRKDCNFHWHITTMDNGRICGWQVTLSVSTYFQSSHIPITAEHEWNLREAILQVLHKLVTEHLDILDDVTVDAGE